MPTKRLLFIGAYALIWSGMIFGSLQIAELPLRNVHSFCGPWGCAAEPNVLLSMHALWTSLLVPFGILVIWACNMARITFIWKVALAASLMMLAGFVAYYTFNYFFYLEGEAQFVLKRGLFRLVTAIDFPIVQLSIATGLNWILCSSIFLYRPEKHVQPGNEPSSTRH